MCNTIPPRTARDLVLVVFCFTVVMLPNNSSADVSIADADITDNVAREFLFDYIVPFNAIDVATEKGTVTLTGQLNDLMTKERATKLAETVRGVRAVFNTITIDPVIHRSASELKDNVMAALRYDAATDTYEISVHADINGKVTLSGNLDSWQQRILAETVAKHVSGVTELINEIIINDKLKRKDEEIKPEIEKRLRWDTLVDHALIDVKVKEGHVFLSGVVGSAAEKRLAEQDARVAGVKTTDCSGLNVARWARDDDLRDTKYTKRSDLEIREAVQNTLLRDPRVNGLDINIEVSKSVAILYGVVNNLKARQAAIAAARNTVGVMDIVNYIKVQPVMKMDDAEIADNVREALLRDTITEGYEINLNVNNGAVYLYGTVASYYQKAQAEDVAFRAKGVNDVRNHLAVDDTAPLVYDPYVDDWSIDDFPWYAPVEVLPMKSDWVLRREIKKKLFWSPYVDADEITISVKGGVTTLTGSVNSWRESDAATENAIEGGATAVINRLKCTCDVIFAAGI